MLHENFSKCSRTSLKTFQSVKWKNIWEQLTMFWIIARNIRKKSFEHFMMFSEEFVWKHFLLFHWNISKCSLTFKKFPNKFVNISKCLSEKNVWEQLTMFWIIARNVLVEKVLNILKYFWIIYLETF